MKFGRSSVNSCQGEIFFIEKVNNAHTQACTHMVVFVYIINRIIKDICIHEFNLPKF